jgi:hypothetical protein
VRLSASLAGIRAAWWALTGLHHIRRSLARTGLAGAGVSPPPAGLPPGARRGALLVLVAARASCLERALLLQRWEAAHGAPAAVVIGVSGPAEGFRAHAWLESAPERGSDAYTEILRIPAPAP